MSVNPTDEDLVITMTLNDREFRRQIAENKRLLKTLQDEIAREEGIKTGSQGVVNMFDPPEGIAPAPRLTPWMKDALNVHKGRNKAATENLKTLRKSLKVVKQEVKELETTLKLRLMLRAEHMAGLKTGKDMHEVIKGNTRAEEQLLKVVEKRVKAEEKTSKKKKDDKKDTESLMRTYTVISSKGARVIATMRGAAGVALGLTVAVAQVLVTTLVRGLEVLQEYEMAAFRAGFALTTAGTSFTNAFGMLMDPSTRAPFEEAGLGFGAAPALMGAAGMTGFEFTTEQLIDLGLAAKLLSESEQDFMLNLTQFMRMFGIGMEDFDTALETFAFMAGRTRGGSGSLTGSLDYISGIAEAGDFDWRELLSVQTQAIQGGQEMGKFWRHLSNILGRVIEDESILSRTIRGIHGDFVGLGDMIWAIDQTMDDFGNEVTANKWALEQFGPQGQKVVAFLRGLVDDNTELLPSFLDLEEQVRLAADAFRDFKAAYDESYSKTFEELNSAIIEMQVALVTFLGPAILDLAKLITGFVRFLTEGTTNMAEGFEDLFEAHSQENRREVLDQIFERPSIWEEDDPTDPGNETEPPENPIKSPALRGGARPRGSVRKTTSSHQTIIQNYITVHDNDSLIRDLIGVNVNI